jgi:hypothetical protein
VGDQLIPVAGRQERRHQDHVGDVRGQRGDRGIPRIDDEQFRVDALPDDPFQDGGLPDVRFDCKYECHVYVYLSGSNSRRQAWEAGLGVGSGSAPPAFTPST